MTAIQRRPSPPPVVVFDQWKDAQRRGFCVWTKPIAAEDIRRKDDMDVGDKHLDFELDSDSTVSDQVASVLKSNQVVAAGLDSIEREIQFNNDDNCLVAMTTSPPTDPEKSLTTLNSLPVEILSHILRLAIHNIPPYQLTRHLERYSLINHQFSSLAQAELFRHPFIQGERGAELFAKVDQRLLDFVKVLTVESRDEDWTMRGLEQVMKGCRGLREVRFRGVTLDLAKFDLTAPAAQITSLELAGVDVKLGSRNMIFPHLRDLTLHNVTCSSKDSIPSFDSLRSLFYSHSLTTSSPLLFQRLIPSIVNIDKLAIQRLYPATQFVDYLLPPSPIYKETSTSFTHMSSSVSSSSSGYEEEEATTKPSLAHLTNLKHLTLLSDSSHHANCFFPLLDTLGPVGPGRSLSTSLETLTVLVDWGYRDRYQEIQGIENELYERLNRESTQLDDLGRSDGLKELKDLVLPREFQGRVERLSSLMRTQGMLLKFAC